MFKRHPYITTALVTTFVSLVVWCFVPAKYGARTKIVDEYKETDIAIGLNGLQATIRDALTQNNVGINDMEVYCKMLATEDFARSLSHVMVPEKGMTYGEYLADEDTIETILDNLEYNLNTKQQAVTIQLEDRNPLVAAQMLDSAVCILQENVTRNRRELVQAALNNAHNELIKSGRDYHKAQQQYAAYMDSHTDILLESEKNEAANLQNNVDLAYKRYQKDTEKYARQKALSGRSYLSFAVSKGVSVPTENTSHPVGYTLFAVVLALIVVKGLDIYRNHRGKDFHFDYGDAFSPWSLTIAIWGVNLLLILSQGDNLYPISTKFWQCFAFWIPLFTASSFISCSLAECSSNRNDTGQTFGINMLAFNVLWCISMLLSPMYVYKVLRIVSQFDTDNLLYNIRMLAISGEGGSLILNSVQAINIALFITAIWLYPRISKLRIVTIIAAYLTVEFAMMEKSGILIMILSTLFVLYQKKVIRIRTIGIIMVCTVLLFFFINMSKEEKDQDTTTFLDFFGMYVTSPAVAFGFLRETIGSQFGMNTFSQVYQYLGVFGFDFDYVERMQEFVYVPVLTNVYTIFQPFYEDFGTFGVAYFAIIYGTLFGWIYGKYRSGNIYSRLLYTYAVEIIIIQFYNENFLQNLFLSVGFIFWTFILAQRTFVVSKVSSNG